MVCNRFSGFAAKYADKEALKSGGGSCRFNARSNDHNPDGASPADHVMLLDEELQSLAGHFVVLEEVYVASCVRRACLSEERNGETNTAMAIEDVFFLVHKCSKRSYKTASLVAALPMGNSVVEILREHILAPLQQRTHAQVPSPLTRVTD